MIIGFKKIIFLLACLIGPSLLMAQNIELSKEILEIGKKAAAQKTTPQHCFFLGQTIYLQKKQAVEIIEKKEKNIRPKVMSDSLNQMIKMAKERCGIKSEDL